MPSIHILIDTQESGGNASYSHQILLSLLREAGITDYSLQSILPPLREAEYICTKKDLTSPTTVQLGQGKYLATKWTEAYLTIQQDLLTNPCNLILTLGPLAASMTSPESLDSIRGTTYISPLCKKKTLSTYSHIIMTKIWHTRPVILADLLKAAANSSTPALTRVRREIWTHPTLADLEIVFSRLLESPVLSIDIETSHGQITCIGFSPSPYFAVVIPFVSMLSPDLSYWSEEEEVIVWNWVKKVCLLPNTKVLQNGLYDIQWLWKKAGITLGGEIHDTMLLHHAQQPEMEKSLGFLGSVYAEESSWKTMRNNKTDTTKRDE